jgi:hypothetical protein
VQSMSLLPPQGLTTWSPLASGVLTGKYSGGIVPEGSRLAVEQYKVWWWVGGCLGLEVACIAGLAAAHSHHFLVFNTSAISVCAHCNVHDLRAWRSASLWSGVQSWIWCELVAGQRLTHAARVTSLRCLHAICDMLVR